MRRRPILLVGLVALLAGALVAGFGAAGAATTSGITGRAVSSVCGGASMGDQTCQKRPVRATIVIVRLSSKQRVATVHGDAAGRFRVALAPGAYELRPSAPRSVLHAAPIDARVHPDRFVHVTVTFFPRHPLPVAPAAG